jgi:tetratricopeptide (TPR) repeat protein
MVKEAEAEQKKFNKALEEPALAGRVLHNNAMYDAGGGPCVLNVQKAMLAGEIEYRKAAVKKAKNGSADFTKAFDHLRNATDLSLNLKYNEPWGQMMPIRHALGALLHEQGQVDEAAQVYREDLAMWKNNMWGLLGLKLCLEDRKKNGGLSGGEEVELADVTKRFAKASQHADEVPKKTCYCAKTCCSE